MGMICTVSLEARMKNHYWLEGLLADGRFGSVGETFALVFGGVSKLENLTGHLGDWRLLTSYGNLSQRLLLDFSSREVLERE